ncbi:MAG: hypothetical protein KJ598_05660 [Nanoarchaeota archaeon]|nr:hypothetical protein [Nanoarchaeota archaeon]MBU1644615.1 hypothetical protein [Nanoarchaeota archaeon]
MKKLLKRFLIMGIALFSLILVSCTSVEKACLVDGDCVPATCCHASDALNKAHGPSCKGVFCTAECQEGTIDCAQGEVKCVSGECKAVINP